MQKGQKSRTGNPGTAAGGFPMIKLCILGEGSHYSAGREG